MTATIGRMVHYTLSYQDAVEIDRRRTDGNSIRERIAADTWPIGAQAHIGNPAHASQVFPAIVVREWDKPGLVNLQVFLDGNDQFWATSREEAPESTPGSWHWPALRAQAQASGLAAGAMAAAGATAGTPNRPLPLFDGLLLLCRRIEACGASPELTHAVTLAGDLMRAVGNQYNPADPYATERVRNAVEEARVA